MVKYTGFEVGKQYTAKNTFDKHKNNILIRINDGKSLINEFVSFLQMDFR